MLRDGLVQKPRFQHEILLVQGQFGYDAKILIDYWDQMAILYVPVLQWTMEKEGLKWIEITSSQDKCQITAVFEMGISYHHN